MHLTCIILHVEDDDNDSFFFQRALRALSFVGTYRRVGTVPDAIRYFSAEGEFSDRKSFPTPDVLVMDSTLDAGKSVAELFAWLKPRPEYEKLVKVALTGTANPAIHDWLRSEGVATTLSKGARPSDFRGAVEAILREVAAKL